VKKVVSADLALSTLKSGMTVMIGGNMGHGTPERLISCLLEKNITDLTIITSDISLPECGIARLITLGMVSKLITSHIGYFPEISSLLQSGKVEAVVLPKGTLFEYIRAGRAASEDNIAPPSGRTGVLQEEKLIRINGRRTMLQVPFKAELALIKAYKSDFTGNLVFRRTARNLNPIMAAAAGAVIAETDVVVNNGVLEKDEILTPGTLIKFVVLSQAD